MKLLVRNLGIVDCAEIDLNKELTLFCGPNGTGKTYVAYLLNALFNLTPDLTTSVDTKNDDDWLHTGQIEIAHQDVETWANEIAALLKTRLSSIFGLSSVDGRKMFASTEIEIKIEDSDFRKLNESEETYWMYLGSEYLFKAWKNKDELIIGLDIKDLSSMKPFLENSGAYKRYILHTVLKTLLLSKYPSRMLTVERNSIYTFKTELLGNRLETVDKVLLSDRNDAEEIVRKRSALYPLAVRNSLKIANDLPEIIKQETEYSEFGDEIERDLLSGSVVVAKEGDVRFVPTSSGNQAPIPLPISMSSSSVKTLSGLVVYLRHLAKKGEVLIIDEPEMNLHPDNQRRLARIFARMVNKGLRLIVSTHSDYIIREFNNFVMLNALRSAGAPLPSFYNEQDALDRKNIQALLFNFDNSQRVRTTSISIDDFGLEVKTIDETIEAQNEQTLILRDTLDAYKEL